MIGRRLWKPAANYHSVGIAGRPMTDDTVDSETILTPIDELPGNRHGEIIDVVREARNKGIPAGIGRCLRLRVRIRIVDLAGIKGLVIVQPAAGNRIWRQVARGAFIGKEIALLVIL